MDGKVASADIAIVEIAERQHGVISVNQLRRAGISNDAIRARTFSGRLHRVYRGVYAVGHSALSPEGNCFAAVLAVGGGPAEKADSVLGYWKAAVSHRSAAFLWGLLPTARGHVDVTVAGNGGKARRSGLRIHRPRSLAATGITLRLGIPVTTPAQTIVDLRSAIGSGAVGAISQSELRRVVRQANILGLPIGDEDVDRTRSDLERDFLRLCRRHRLQPPEVNVRIGLYLVDFLWREKRFVVETDSYLYHRGLEAFQGDRGRDLELKRCGYEVLRLSERQLNEEADLVAETLTATLYGREG
ncbi:MAG: type IV toxin-antitoxin system AbiEi family antitoxin domain-containing protein [Solirubrobacterales bacterium]